MKVILQSEKIITLLIMHGQSHAQWWCDKITAKTLNLQRMNSDFEGPKKKKIIKAHLYCVYLIIRLQGFHASGTSHSGGLLAYS